MKKPLEELTLEELWQLFPIILSEYQPVWVERYHTESIKIQKAFPVGTIIRMNHIGSTAVPGLLAKPTIDILMEVAENTDSEEIIQIMQKLEYIYSPQPENPEPHMMFMKGYTPEGFKGQAYHVHIRYPDDWNEIYFRDYLKKHPLVAREYEKLKLKLQTQSGCLHSSQNRLYRTYYTTSTK